ncbi:hypothetical protein SDC9_99973 [bioreactor metagenome]|uniref:Uncharacterized protein n=1 Tax=bioreactor metagenome TaxID=1076179 RepID=A0A645AKE9_9ZZZZ
MGTAHLAASDDHQRAAGQARQDRGVGDREQRWCVDHHGVVLLGDGLHQAGHRDGSEQLGRIRRHRPGRHHVKSRQAPRLQDVSELGVPDQHRAEAGGILQPQKASETRLAQVGIHQQDAQTGGTQCGSGVDRRAGLALVSDGRGDHEGAPALAGVEVLQVGPQSPERFGADRVLALRREP